MPNRLMLGWDAMNKTGNPMKSIPVSDLIKKIKKKEVQKKGKMSMARCGLVVAAEFEQLWIYLKRIMTSRGNSWSPLQQGFSTLWSQELTTLQI
jgi:hypothetical protein